MPSRKQEKLLTIGQVARLLGVSASSLRNWEKLGLITPVRTSGRYRLYSPDDVRRLKRVQFLRRVKRINPPGILHLRRHDAELLNLAATGSGEIGERLAQMRKARGLSVQAAANQAGLSAPFVSRVERGTARPAIAALKRLTAVYGASMLAFFNLQAPSRALVRPRDRRVFTAAGVRMELLAFGGQLHMEAQLFLVAPRASSGGSYNHEGEEFIYMLSGKFEIWLDEVERYLLEPGDSLYFNSIRSHRWGCVGDEAAVLLWINSPPTF